MTVAQILTQTLERLRAVGWCSNGMREGTKECVLFAMGQVAHDYEDLFVSAMRLVDRLCGGAFTIGAWNDSEGRTFADVEALLTAAIAIAKEQEQSQQISVPTACE